MRIKVILNPRADRGRAAELADQIESWRGQAEALDLMLTSAPGEAQAQAAEAAAAGYDVVAAAGGDGTVNEVANGLLQEADRGRRPALAIIPIGSGNDYAFGLDLMTAPTVALARLFSEERRQLDVALVTDGTGRTRYACNGIGIGFDATVAVESLKIKRLYGFPAYALAAVKTILFRFHAPHLSLQFDEQMVEQRALLLAIGVGPRVGGGFHLTPDASFSDGLLDTCLVEPIGRLMMVAMLPRVMQGTHVSAPFVEMRRSRVISLVSDRALPIHVDGEIFATAEDDVRELRVETVPAALTILV